MSVARLLAAGAVTAAGLAGMAALSYVPYAHESGAGSELRLAWRARSARVEACRRRTADELARLPVHMRQEQVCERQVAPYRLAVWLDGSPVTDRLIVAAGASADRPLYVFEEFPLAPGTHALRVTFTRETGASGETAAAADPRAAPARLALDTAVTLTAGRAGLVTYDEDARRLYVVIQH
jgi:hypothetical protein